MLLRAPTPGQSQRLATLWLALAVAAATGCGSSTTTAAGPVCAELYGQGLTGCTEHCRPFGVLDFGTHILADGTVVWTCECMPGPNQSEETTTPEGKGSDDESTATLEGDGQVVSAVAGVVAPLSAATGSWRQNPS